MLRKNYLKTAFFSITTLALISIGMPDIAQAQNRGTLPTDRYIANYRIATGKKDTNPDPTKGRFVEAIQDFKIFDKFFNPPIIVPKSTRGLLTLETSILSNSNFFTNSNFSNISGPIYEYKFFVTAFQNIPLNPNYQPFPYDNFGYFKWYLPSNAIYTTASGKTFSYAFDNGNSAKPQQDFVNSLKGLTTIMQMAKGVGLSSITPTNIILNDGTQAVTLIKTTSVPEPNTSASLIILGLAGSLMLFQRKLDRDNHS